MNNLNLTNMFGVDELECVSLSCFVKIELIFLSCTEPKKWKIEMLISPRLPQHLLERLLKHLGTNGLAEKKM